MYIDGRLVGAVSYSLGQFSKEPIAGITPIGEMTEAATFAAPRRQAARVELQMPLTPESLRASLRQAFSWARPFADSPADVQVFGGTGLNAGIGTLLRPIATPLTLGGFDPRRHRSDRVGVQRPGVRSCHGGLRRRRARAGNGALRRPRSRFGRAIRSASRS